MFDEPNFKNNEAEGQQMKVEAAAAVEKSKFISQSELSPLLNNSNPMKKETIVGFEDLTEDEEEEFL